MTQPANSKLPGREVLVLAARWILGGVFIYMGLIKALHPVDFLKVLRQYEMVESHVLLNVIAAMLPWFEVLCGLLLLAGVAVRASALVLIGMLVPFTFIVLKRALAIHAAKAIAFCAISFDCGCGGGEVIICHKLVENGLLILLSVFLLCVRASRWCLRYELLKSSPATASELGAAEPQPK
jgi:putative oxidoreductase